MAMLFSVAALLAIGRPFWHYGRALRTNYIITDRRIMFICEFIWQSIESYDPPFDFKQRIYGDASGTIYFSRDEYNYDRSDKFVQQIGLFAIPNVEEFADKVLDLDKKFR